MPDVFNKFWDETKKHDADHPVLVAKVRVDESPNFNLSILKQNIDNVDSMSDVELRNFIKRCFKSIMVNLFGKEMPKYIHYFQDVRFLDAFIDVLKSMDFIEKDDIVRLNTMCYHYITIPKDKQNYRVVSRMMEVSNIINRHNLPRLLGLGLSSNLASILLIARYSDIDLNVCVKRVNFIIITQPKELMSERMIEEILKILYNVLDDLVRIFPPIMMDILPDYDENNPNTLWISEDIQEVNSTLNLALLNILDNLPTQTIRSVLLNYTEAMNMVYKNYQVRFSLRCLSEDYYRINNVINEMALNEGIYVI